MAEGLYNAEFDHLIRQKAQAPFRTAFRGFRAGQPDQFRLFFSTEFPLVLPVRTFALDRSLKAALAKAPPDSSNPSFGQFEGLPDSGIRPRRSFRSFVGLQQNPGASLLAGRALPTTDPFEKAAPLFGRKLDTVCFL